MMPSHKHPLGANLQPTIFARKDASSAWSNAEKDVEEVMFRLLLNINFLRHPGLYMSYSKQMS